MIARFSGATLGLLAFSVAILGGLWVGNPATEILSRAIWSLVIFCALGLVLGAAAQAVVEEYARKRFDAVRADVEAAKSQEKTEQTEENQDSGEAGVQETG